MDKGKYIKERPIKQRIADLEKLATEVVRFIGELEPAYVKRIDWKTDFNKPMDDDEKRICIAIYKLESALLEAHDAGLILVDYRRPPDEEAAYRD